MIPKKIHYCWFGENELPKKARKCINSWKKFCPDYEIVEWNESNYDINQNPYTQIVYQNKQYAFLSDYARLQIIYKEGGIYLDVDVEIVRSLDQLLCYKAFFGFETDQFVNTGIGFGAEKCNELVRSMIREYDILLDGKHGVIGCPVLNTKALIQNGLILNGKNQIVCDGIIFSAEYFNPYDDPTGRLKITENTYSIHWFAKSWLSKKDIIRSKLTKPIHRIFGVRQ